jgi:hypothetical protein
MARMRETERQREKDCTTGAQAKQWLADHPTRCV